MPRHSYIALTNQNRIHMILPQLNSVLSVTSKYLSGLQIQTYTVSHVDSQLPKRVASILHKILRCKIIAQT